MEEATALVRDHNLHAIELVHGSLPDETVVNLDSIGCGLSAQLLIQGLIRRSPVVS